MSALLGQRGATLPWPPTARLRGAKPIVMDALVAAGVAAALLPLTVASLSATAASAGWTATVLGTFLVLHLTLALRRTSPVLGYLLACLMMLVVVLAPDARISHPSPGAVGVLPMLFLQSSLTFLPVLYSVGFAAGRRTAAGAIVVAAFGALLAGVRVGQVVPSGYPVWQYRLYVTFALLLAVSAAWGLGISRANQVRREAVRRVEATRTAILAERSRIARDMHDVVAHSLAVMVRQAEGGALLATRSPERAAPVLRTIAEVGREALADMRGMLDVLRHPDGDGSESHSPDIAPQSSLNDLPPLLARVRAAGLGVEVTERGTRHDLGTAGELAAHHVIREALTNAIKHAGPGAQVEVTLDWQAEALLIEIRDSGGARSPRAGERDPHPPVPGTGTGLRGLQERVSAVRGIFSAGPGDAGFVVRATLPRRSVGAAR